jgi:hypothetical protein
MGREVELGSLDLRYENYRMKHPALEVRAGLLADEPRHPT